MNRTLIRRNREPVIVEELRGIIITHVLCTSDGESLTTICSPKERDACINMGIKSSHYHKVWSALSCTTGKRERAEHTGDSWSNRPTNGNALIVELEDEIASINRHLLLVPGSTIFSLDDDHHRLSSKDVANLTTLSHINNPVKALGPVTNAICSALIPVVIACHHSRPRESLKDVWTKLVQLFQGNYTTG